jgi:hypothetical protein
MKRFLLFLLLLGCGPSVDSGVVVDKRHRAAWVQMVPIIVNKIPVMTPIHHPEKWTVTICETPEVCETHRVSKTLFESVTIGQKLTIAERDNK